MEFQYALDEDKPVFDQKNVRRRVYDALNVLMAMDIIAKDKKEIRWLGIPSCFRSDNASEKHEADLLEEIKKEQCLQDELSSTVDQLQTTVRDHIFRQLILRQLIWRNVNNPCKDKQIFPLPLFLLCPSSADEVHIELSENQRSAVITCNSSLDGRAIFEDIDVLDRLNLDSFRPQDWPCDASPLPLSKPSINNLPTSPSSSTSSDA
ncbi:uncharacterized protein BYT42DRAFT_556760 [Radiomyces spectabilis]|uniref:uncharacterized protein n=1 Tax=Radiomyces spectabilis TaxID=64574 RepID=UPI002220BA4F|nr:uncharacterized protein BYT42DRAFT_556760 [Radiomyces spectabilis]KAI8391403.1 hypothetical protein BYT42DRAFT_556760 [Radiomyces spectabilis]